MVQKTEISMEYGNIFSSVSADRPKTGSKSVIFGKNISTNLQKGKTISTIEHLSFIPLKNSISNQIFRKTGKTDPIKISKKNDLK
jgi:UDP-3-O-acyl-N-acetylglucosamine deacetylase